MNRTVTITALIARINRKLATDLRKLRTARPGTWQEREFGRLYVWDYRTNGPVEQRVDIVELARELDALGTGETVIDNHNVIIRNN